MKTSEKGKLLTTVPALTWWMSDKLEKYCRKREKADSDAIDNLERLYHLKERGAISDSDYEELKERIIRQI